jgi:hypothetical protein
MPPKRKELNGTMKPEIVNSNPRRLAETLVSMSMIGLDTVGRRHQDATTSRLSTMSQDLLLARRVASTIDPALPVTIAFS